MLLNARTEGNRRDGDKVTQSGASQPAGWYHAQGDPPGTQRYWDGAQWVGGPQAAQDQVVDAGAGAPYGAYGQQISYGGSGGSGAPASFGSRLVAYLIDFVATLGVALAGVIVGFLLGLAANAISNTLGTIVFVLVAVVPGLVFQIWNFFIRQGRTGQTIGKQQQSIMLIADDTRAPIGAGRCFVRYLLGGLIGSFCYIDYLWPLWDEQRKRLSDKILDLSVVDA